MINNTQKIVKKMIWANPSSEAVGRIVLIMVIFALRSYISVSMKLVEPDIFFSK